LSALTKTAVLKIISKTVGVKHKTPITTYSLSTKVKSLQPVKWVNNDVFSFNNPVAWREKKAVIQKQVQFKAECQKHCTDTKILPKASTARGDASISTEQG
jgi:hypothetical protein